MSKGGIIPVLRQQARPHEMIYADEATGRALKLARSVARTASTVLLTGESGVGKEIFAREIHRASPRSKRAFEAVNCAALPSSLLESELFGHEKGSFSGAVQRHIGHFERASGGTILLDEISEISLETQAKLLRVLQERSMRRVGGSQEVALDLRVVATTNRDLREHVERGAFRLDLFYRLNVFPIAIPPLRARRRDIEPLSLYYLSLFAERFALPLQGLRVEALERLEAHRYDGNVRELVNVLERAAILCGESEIVEPEHIVLEAHQGAMFAATPEGLAQPSSPSHEFTRRPTSRHLAALSSRKMNAPSREREDEGEKGEQEVDPALSFLPGSEPLTDVRRKIIIGTLERFDGNRTRTAEALGVSLRTIRNKLRHYRERGIDVPSPGEDT